MIQKDPLSGKFVKGDHPQKTCKTCYRVFSIFPSQSARVFCSRKCVPSSQRGKTLSIEHRHKLSISHMGQRPSQKTLEMARLRCGKKSHNWGKHLSEETKEKIRQARLKYGVIIQCLWCDKQFKRRRKIIRFCSMICARQYRAIQHRTNKKCPQCNTSFFHLICKPRLCCSAVCAKKFFVKDRHPSWAGGIKKDNDRRKSFEGIAWRKAVFEKDNYTCQICKIRGGILQADHIKPYSIYRELRFELSNGRTLCVTCHKQTATYGGRLSHSMK